MHNCVKELRSLVQCQQLKIHEMQTDVSELKLQHAELKRELLSVRVSDLFRLFTPTYVVVLWVVYVDGLTVG